MYLLLVVGLSLPLGGCQDPTGVLTDPSIPEIQAASSHVQVRQTPARPPRERPVIAMAPGRPPMVPQDPTTYARVLPNQGDSTNVDEVPDERSSSDVAAQTPMDEAERWLIEAGMQSPGCILDGRQPDLPLPSPAALEHILRVQPESFDGTARESLVCLLQLPKVTGAQVYGKTAFQPWVLHGQFSLAGGKRRQGIVVTPIVTTTPKEQGTLYVVLDRREQGWFIRTSRYIPWTGDQFTRRLNQLKVVRLTSSRRRAIRVTQGDSMHSTQHYLELTPAQRLVEVFRVVTRDKATAQKTTVKLSGSGYPKTITTRTKYSAVDGLQARYEIQRYEADSSLRYQQVEEIEGPLRRNQATLLIPKKRFVDALWILNALTDAEQKSAQTYVVKARIAEARKRYKTALRYWRRATKAKDALPSVHRDYGRYLAERKRWRTAAKALRRYLKLAPDALDAPDIINELEQLKRKKR